MTQERAHHSRALDSFAVSALGITFFLRYAHFLTAHELFGPFVDNVHMYGPIFSEVSRLALAGALPYYLPDIGTGFPVFESPHFSILYPFYFFGIINYWGTAGISLHVDLSNVSPSARFFTSTSMSYCGAPPLRLGPLTLVHPLGWWPGICISTQVGSQS
jgi:hypothetical protein